MRWKIVAFLLFILAIGFSFFFGALAMQMAYGSGGAGSGDTLLVFVMDILIGVLFFVCLLSMLD